MSFTHRVNHRDQCLSVSFQQVPFSLSLCASVSIASDLPDLITENACKNRTNNNTVGTDKCELAFQCILEMHLAMLRIQNFISNSLCIEKCI